jgi:hypothetical protein
VDANSSQWVDSSPVTDLSKVTSVNGKIGNLTLNATDVAALPLSGGTLTGPLSVTGIVSSTNIANFKNNLLSAVTASTDLTTLKAAIISALTHL